MQAYSRRPRSPRPALQLPSGRLVRITADNFIIGSGESCHLPLKDNQVAERHVIVQRAGDHWQAALLSLDDSASVNKEPLQGIVRLQNGDTLQIGRTRLRYVEDDAAIGMTGLLWSRWWLLALLLVAALVIVALALAAVEREQTPDAAIPDAPPAVVTTPAPATPTVPPTPAVPTATPTAELNALPVTSTPEATNTPMPENTPTVVAPSPTAAIDPDLAIIPGCPMPEGWQIITVAEDENLGDLATRFNIARARLQRANCLDSFLVRPGQQLFVPR